MVTFFIVLLVISQIICFYFFVLLNVKITKFNDLEVRQDRLIREMDDAIAVYLLEMRDENDRLIQELSTISKSDETNKQSMGNMNTHMKEQTVKQPVAMQEGNELKIEPKTFISKNIATNAYKRQNNQTKQQKQNEELVETNVTDLKTGSFENRVIALHSEGKTIEEIAKMTQKGKTEIELLLKFHA